MNNKNPIKVNPIVSVITVNLNNCLELEKTINSVLLQSYKYIDFIVIDGGSVDGSIDILKKYESKINFWISEKDFGIYDAMNKGISFAKGDIINFLNAGDFYYDKKILELISETYSVEEFPDLIYGSAYCYSPEAQINYISGTRVKDDNLWKGMPICHQSIFFKKSLFNILGNFNLDYKISADYEWLLRFRKNIKNYNFKDYFIDLPLIKFKLYGLSSSNYLENLNEIENISKKYFLFNFSKKLHFYLKKVKYIFLKILAITKLIYLYKKIKYNIVYKISFNLRNKNNITKKI